MVSMGCRENLISDLVGQLPAQEIASVGFACPFQSIELGPLLVPDRIDVGMG